MNKLLYAFVGLFFLSLIVLLTGCNDNKTYTPGDKTIVEKDSVNYNVAPDSTVKRRGPGGSNKLN